MNPLLPHGLQHALVLDDGSRWIIAAGNDEAIPIVSQLADAMQLSVMNASAAQPLGWLETGSTGGVEPPDHGIVRRLLIFLDAQNARAPLAMCHAPVPFEPFGDDGLFVCVLRSIPFSIGLYIHLVALSSVVAQDAQTRGGVLLHGALAEEDGIGVILAAPSRTGKTTASRRLLAPWRSLCDDTTLVVRDAQGNYWAHPWPTWSRFAEGASGGSWDVQTAVPLRGIFFLSQAVEDRVKSVGPGQAVSLLVECAEQTSPPMARDLSKKDARTLRLERFNNICTLAQVVPAHVLHISLTGAFWQQIEQTLEGRSRDTPVSSVSGTQSEISL